VLLIISLKEIWILSLRLTTTQSFFGLYMKEYENDKGEPYYYISKEVLEDLYDINRTYEVFERFYLRYVVSRRVYDYLIEKVEAFGIL